MQRVYGFFFKTNEEKNLIDKKEAIRMMDNPILYDNDAWDYSLILSQSLGENFTTTKEFDIFFEAVVRLFNDNTFVDNGLYDDFFITNLDINEKLKSIKFIWNNELQFILTDNKESFKVIYPLPDQYYVVYDESQNVENEEMLPLMADLCNELGRDNIYEAVRQWNYIDVGIKVSFYIFYSGKKPNDIVSQEIIRNFLIRKYGLEEAKRRFPKLFIDTQRRVFCLYKNEGYPIDFDLMSEFVKSFNITSPEIVHMLDYVSPIVVEYGLSDIFPNFKEHESTDYLNNKILFYITQVLNYYNGKKLDRVFIEESQFGEYEDYCSVVCANIEWRVMKKDYLGSYFILND